MNLTDGYDRGCAIVIVSYPVIFQNDPVIAKQSKMVVMVSDLVTRIQISQESS